MVSNMRSTTRCCGFWVAQLFVKYYFCAQLPNMYSELVFRTYVSPERMFDVCGAAVAWGRTPVWELRPTIGAAWELHLAAAFGRLGAALKTRPGAASMAGRGCSWELRRPVVKFSHGSCKFRGSCASAAASSYKTYGSCIEHCGSYSRCKI